MTALFLTDQQKKFFMRNILPFLAVFCFATYGSFGKNLVSNLHPIILVVALHAVSITIFTFFFGLFPEVKKLRLESTGHRVAFLLFTLFSGAIGPFLFLTGLQYTSAINAVILLNSYPLFMLFYSVVVFKKEMKNTQYLGMLVLLCGIVLVVLGGNGWNISFNIGDLIIVVSQLSFCSGDVLYKKYLAKVEPEVAVFGRNLMAFVFMGLLALFFVSPEVEFSHVLYLWKELLMMAIITVLIAQFLWYTSVKVSSTFALTKAQFLNPIFGVFWAWLLLSEYLTIYHFLGLALVFLGLKISSIKRAPHFFANSFHLYSLYHPYIHNGDHKGWWDYVISHFRHDEAKRD